MTHQTCVRSCVWEGGDVGGKGPTWEGAGGGWWIIPSGLTFPPKRRRRICLQRSMPPGPRTRRPGRSDPYHTHAPQASAHEGCGPGARKEALRMVRGVNAWDSKATEGTIMALIRTSAYPEIMPRRQNAGFYLDVHFIS